MPHADNDVGRRAFLARIGVLGAAVAAGSLLPGTATAAPRPVRAAGVTDVVAALRPVLAELARDTLNGLVVMTCPGPDAYSRAQGTPRTEPGALEARATDFLIKALDEYVPFPDQLATPLTQSLATGLSGTPLPSTLLDLPLSGVRTLDAALRTLLENDDTLPLSSVIAMLLNLFATEVNPLALGGAFLSPFARLSYADKCRVFEQLEGPHAGLVALLDANLPEPLRASVSGVLRFVAGAVLEFAAYGSSCEWAVFDRATKTISARPVGWQLSGYQPHGVVHGWDDFLGYYQGRTKVENV
ncbi:hypothetical protein [Amycolatopsis sp. NPDC006125]|uniref:hypothetical protein n=1 Tax=Amycolatopsis sp. NPDC006125 TaxID=3156730 RepID=UPI0033AED0FB